jgi:hypothetical protein
MRGKLLERSFPHTPFKNFYGITGKRQGRSPAMLTFLARQSENGRYVVRPKHGLPYTETQSEHHSGVSPE